MILWCISHSTWFAVKIPADNFTPSGVSWNHFHHGMPGYPQPASSTVLFEKLN
jgi:hypothetical protein